MFGAHPRDKQIELVDAQPTTEKDVVPLKSSATTWERIKDDWRNLRINKTLFIVLPLIIIIELALNLSMDIIPPDHDVHIATYCATCGLTVGVSFSTFVPGATSDELRAYAACMEDAMLLLIGEAFQTFNVNYTATLLGHILTVYALIASLDGSLTPKLCNLRSLLHGLAYTLLLVDILAELILLFYIDAHDPDSIDVMQTYTACDATVVKEIIDVKNFLVEYAIAMIVWRTTIAAVVTLIYIIEVEYTGDDADVDDEEQEDQQLIIAEDA